MTAHPCSRYAVMDFELKLEKPQTKMACIEGLVMGVSYLVGEQAKNSRGKGPVTALTEHE